MLTKRIIPCLDIKNGKVVKGINFVELKDVGDPIELAKRYDQQCADEVVFLDITASYEERDIIKDIIKHFHDMPVNFGIYDENYLAVLKDDYLAQRLAKSDDIPYQVVDFEELLKHQQSKLIVICDPKDMPTIVKHGQLFSHPAVKSLQAGKIEYEYMHPKLSKSHGINMLCTWHQIEIENICAFGDADNDADMIHDVGIGIAMENASPLTKSYAKAITLDNQNDGVAEYIEKFILGEEK